MLDLCLVRRLSVARTRVTPICVFFSVHRVSVQFVVVANMRPPRVPADSREKPHVGVTKGLVGVTARVSLPVEPCSVLG